MELSDIQTQALFKLAKPIARTRSRSVQRCLFALLYDRPHVKYEIHTPNFAIRSYEDLLWIQRVPATEPDEWRDASAVLKLDRLSVKIPIDWLDLDALDAFAQRATFKQGQPINSEMQPPEEKADRIEHLMREIEAIVPSSQIEEKAGRLFSRFHCGYCPWLVRFPYQDVVGWQAYCGAKLEYIPTQGLFSSPCIEKTFWVNDAIYRPTHHEEEE